MEEICAVETVVKLEGEDGEVMQRVQVYLAMILAVSMRVTKVVSLEYQVLNTHVT